MKQVLREYNLPVNAIFLYLEVVGNFILGFAYWVIITKLAGAAMLGTVSAMSSFAILLYTFTALGIPLGAMRLMGKANAQGQSREFSAIFNTSLIVLVTSSILGTILVIVLRDYLYTLTDLTTTYLYMACIIAILTGISSAFRSVFICVRRTLVIPLSVVLGGLVRIGAGIVLVWLGWGTLGASIGYGMLAVVKFVLLLGFLVVIPVSLFPSRSIFSMKVAGEVIKAGAVNWFPLIILAVGSQLGILIVYGIRGPEETGFYFIAYTIASAVWAIPSSIWETALPVLSGMVEGRKRLTWKGTKLGMVITVPIIVILFLCSNAILGFFGSEFLLVYTALTLLLASALFIPILNGVQTLAYARGEYREVLLIGLASNVPKVVLYLVLVPLYGANGAALAFLVGTALGFVYSIIVALRMGFHLFWRQTILILSLPVGIGAAAYFLHLHWILVVILVPAACIIGYVMLKVVTIEEIKEIISFLRLGAVLGRL